MPSADATLSRGGRPWEQFVGLSLAAVLLALPVHAKAAKSAAAPPPLEQEDSALKPMPPDLPRPKQIHIDPSWPAEKIEFMEKLTAVRWKSDIEWETERDDRRELVWPAPKGYKPEVQGKKIRVRLIPRATRLNKGESFWYRLEIQNIGSEEVRAWRAHFLKDGGLERNDRFQFRITSPDGKAENIFIGGKGYWLQHGLGDDRRVHMSKTDIDDLLNKRLDKFEDFMCTLYGSTNAYDRSLLQTPDWSGLSEAQRKTAFRDWWYREDRKVDLNVRILPGETLASSPWEYHSCEEAEARKQRGLGPFPPAKGRFRQLKTPYPFEEPGIYRIRVTYTDPPPNPPSKAMIKDAEARGISRKLKMKWWRESVRNFLGTVVSNEVKIERLP